MIYNIIKKLFKKIKNEDTYEINNYSCYLDLSNVKEKVLDKNLQHLNNRRCFICDSVNSTRFLDVSKDVVYFCPKCWEKVSNKYDGIIYNEGGFINMITSLRYQYKEYISKKKNKGRKNCRKKLRRIKTIL